MNTKSPWMKIDAAGLGVCLALTLVVYVMGVQPLIARKAEVVQRQRELDDRRQKADDLASTLTNLRRELALAEQSLAKSRLQLYPVSAVNQRLAMITDLASDHHLKLNEIMPGKPTNGTHYDTVPILITGSGNYGTIAAFLHRMHTTFPDTGVAAFSLAGNPAEPGAPATFQFSLAWYAAPINRIDAK